MLFFLNILLSLFNNLGVFCSYSDIYRLNGWSYCQHVYKCCVKGTFLVEFVQELFKSSCFFVHVFFLIMVVELINTQQRRVTCQIWIFVKFFQVKLKLPFSLDVLICSVSDVFVLIERIKSVFVPLLCLKKSSYHNETHYQILSGKSSSA
jgi:hypothetical protein